MKILGFGDNTIDRFIDRGIEYPGGNCVNVAVFAGQRGADAGYMGVFGSDEPGDFMRTVLTSLGVDLSHSVTRKGESGLARVEVAHGERIFMGGTGGITTAEPIILSGADLEYIAGFDLVHSSVYSTSESELAKLDVLPTLVSYDISSEEKFRTPAYLDRVAPHVDLVLASCSHNTEDESRHVLREIARRGATMALGTRGSDGAMLYDGVTFHEVPAVPIPSDATVIDTMGCGDAFLAAFEVELLRAGWNRGTLPGTDALERSLGVATSFATLQCSQDGAFGHGRAYEGTVSTSG